MFDKYRKNIGNIGEEVAVKFLISKGYKVLERNYLIRGGEIDIIALDGDTLVFIEVKARYSHEYGLPIEAMTPWKLKALKKSALFYVQDNNLENKLCRFDFLGIDYTNSKESPDVELIKNILD